MTHNTKLISQLRALALLTQTADHAAERSLLITEQLRTLGGVPDFVTPAIGRAGAVLKATFEQAAPLEEALLTDLQLEHQLHDRATYLKVLADQAKQADVRRLAEKLIDAHKATVRWLPRVAA